jgi:prophage regulatory protein
MHFELESSDIEAIANLVASKLVSNLDEIKKLAVRDAYACSPKFVEVNENTKPKSIIVNTNEVVNLTGLSRSTVWRLEKIKHFPGRRILSGRRVGWLRSEVEAWIETRQVL